MARVLQQPLAFALSFLFVAAAGAVPAAAQDTEAGANPHRLELADGDTLVFLGDSITHQCLYTQYVEDFFYTRFPKMRIKFHNAGVGGARAWDALARFERDVARYKPKYVTVLLGMNDGSYRPYDEAVFQTYKQDMTTVIEKIEACGATPVLMTPTMFDARAARNGKRKREPAAVELYNSVLAYYGSWLRDVADREGYGFVDMYSPLNNLTRLQRKKDADFTMIADAVHPGPSGQLVMAYALLDDMGLRAPLSNIRVTPGAKQAGAVRASGGKVTELKWDAEQVAFHWHPEALPYVLPEDTAAGADLLHLGHRLSREGLEVHGLQPGRYEVVIDGVQVGVYPHTALARHIELQGNPMTPQYQQALQVAMLNKQRNEGPIRNLRGEWSRFQRYARAQRDLAKQPENEDLKQQVASLAGQIEGMEERVAQHERAAEEIEAQIFQKNVPATRQFVIRRLPSQPTNAN